MYGSSAIAANVLDQYVGALRPDRREQLIKRLAGTNPPGHVVQLRVAKLTARPPIQKCLGDTRIEALSPH
jgi:hypothetical protein